MSAIVTIAVINGKLRGKEFTFEKSRRCLVGRGTDCDLRLPDDYLTISRHHCLLDIDPPAIAVRDMGSRNGTYVNRELIGQRAQSTDHASLLVFPECELNDGDEIQVGTTILHVNVVVDADEVEEGSPHAAVAC